MDAFERGLNQSIPMDEAASFFMKMKYGSNPEEKLASRDVAVVRGKVKTANVGMMGTPPPPASMTPATPPALPATAKGMNSIKMAAKLKRAFDEMFGEDSGAPGSVAPDVDMNQYIATEQLGRAAEEENQVEFLRQKLQAAVAETQAARDMASTAQTSAEQLQTIQAQHQQELQAAQQQAQLATDAAMENVNQAHELALKATSQALQAKDDAINTHQMAAQMRMAYQDMRGSIMDAVAQDAAAPIGEAIKQKGLESQAVPPQGTQDPAGPDGTGPDPGAEGAPKEGAQGDTPNPQNVNKDAAPQEAADQTNLSAPAAGPGTVPPMGEDHKSQANADGGGGLFDGSAGAQSNSQRGTTDQKGVVSTDAAAKQASVKLAGPWGAVFQQALGHLKSNAPYAAAGGALGAALPFVESRVGHDALREKVQKLEGQEGGFGQALQLAKSKMQLALGEVAEKHPKSSMLAGGVIGAGAGMALGPHIIEGFKELPGMFRSSAE